MSGRGPRGRARTRVRTEPSPERVTELAAEQAVEAAEAGRGRIVIEPVTEQPVGPSIGRAVFRGGLIETGEEEPERRPIESVPTTRPKTCVDKRGTSGTPVDLFTNYFEIISQPNWILYQYHVEFDPEIKGRRLKVALLNNHNYLFPQNKAFDGTIIYTLTNLVSQVTEVTSIRAFDQAPIKIKIKKINEIAPVSPNFVHFLNIVFRRCLQLYGIVQIGRNYYDMNSRIEIRKYNLEILHGFATSIANYEMKLMLCVELSHRLMHTETIYDMLSNFYHQDRLNYKKNFLESVIGQIIMTKYSDKTYRVDDIEWNLNATFSFTLRDGRSITLIDYYKQHYNIDIREINQPLLVSLPRRQVRRRGQTGLIYLIPELCVLTGMSESMRQDSLLMRDLTVHTRVDAARRLQNVREFVNNVPRHPKVQTELDKWQIKFETEPKKLQGRRLDNEVLIFGEGLKKQLVKADWTADLRSIKHLVPIELKNWIVFCFARDEQLVNQSITKLAQISEGMGVNTVKPEIIALTEDKTEQFILGIKTKVKPETQMVLAILSNSRKDRYDAIKRLCCLELPVPSQVILLRNFKDQTKLMSILTKVAVQINCKIGGEIWAVSIPLSNVMICGIDTYHDSERKDASVCGFVATTNRLKTKFYSRATLQTTHQELSSNLTLNVTSAINYYIKENNTRPDMVIVYRDGISDGQLPLVTDHEIPQIIKAFEYISGDYNPRIAVIVVKKRGNTRFFRSTDNKIINPEFGTIIDNTVTRAEWYDFYLISQSTHQGTVNPTHFNVVYDTTGLKPDHLQRLSYKLTHMYYNWSGTIRVPALCQYAHKLAYLVGSSLHREHNLSLSNKLFYL